MNSVGDMIKYLRKREGLTQQELSNKIHISRSRLNNYEQGIREPDFETLELFADFFNVDMNFLCGNRYQNQSYNSLSPDEISTIETFRKLPEDKRKLFRDLLLSFSKDS